MRNVTASSPVSRRGRKLALALLASVAVAAACTPQQQASGPFPRLAEFDGQEVRRVTFSGDIRFSEDSLRAVIRTRPSRCRFLFLPFCLPFTNLGRDEYRLDLDELALDVGRIQLYHRDHGYYGAQVAPDVQSLEEDRVAVEFAIAAGRQVMLRSLAIQGVDTLLAVDELLNTIPLKLDEPFGRLAFLASADTIRRQLLQRGHAYADVLRNYGIDTIAGVAEVEYVAIPGPLVFVDTVLFEGNERMSERALRRYLTVREGEVLRAEELSRSQRNLYNLEMVNFASVRLAPDTLQLDQAQHNATVLVQLVEAAQFAVEASAGFGTVDCFRTSGRWINRNFLGGGRRLEVLGSLSRVGVGDPVDFGLERSVCSALGEENFALSGPDARERLDYRASVNFQQPSIFGAQNQLAINLHSERISETEAYIRDSTGGEIAASREFDAGPTVLTTTAMVELGRTIASPAILCVGFDTCSEADFAFLSEFRWSNVLSFGLLRDASFADGVTSRGYILRGGADWSSPLFGSENDYLRVLGEAAYYHPLKPGWTAAANLRFGRFLRGTIGEEGLYIPPERRFYAGGPASVRGYTRNALGPTVYVDQDGVGPDAPIGSATGGTQMIVASLELRMPSPWMADIMRAAVFVDAGHVSALDTELISPSGIRITPGAGLRFLTPVGPFRLDVAYNPYRRAEGPLYFLEAERNLFYLYRRYYDPPEPTFLGRFRVQFALGQAF